MSAVTTGRREDMAAAAGRLWADSVRASLEAEGRPVSGGWPGTMSEARARLPDDLGRGLESEEVSRLTRVLYHAARDSWLGKPSIAS